MRAAILLRRAGAVTSSRSSLLAARSLRGCRPASTALPEPRRRRADDIDTLKFTIGEKRAGLAADKGPLALYERLIEDGELHDDQDQRRVMQILNAIYHGVPRKTAKGLYVYGSVGCGKTMAMDLFLTSVKNIPGVRVQRKHFHDFLNEVHVELFKRRGTNNKVQTVAHSIADRLDVLCFDEFAITSIQDCTIVMPLFTALFERRVVVIATSNRSPDDLYTDGLNREFYMPNFIQALKDYCKVHKLSGRTDYRRVHFENSPDAGVYCWPPDRGFVDRWFADVGGASTGGGHLELSFGKKMSVPNLSACGRIARFEYEDLCGSNPPFMGADDFLWLSRQLHTMVLDNVPKFTIDQHNEARRFTMLVDSLYESHVRLVCSMEVAPEELLGELSKLQNMTMQNLGGDAPAGTGDGDTSSSGSGVLQAIARIKENMSNQGFQRGGAAVDAGGGSAAYGTAHVNPRRADVLASRLKIDSSAALEVLGANVRRIKAAGDKDTDTWRQEGNTAPLHASKSWDDRRRISAFTWESSDPTQEQSSVKGVFTAAIAALQESGFAVERCISRLREMQTATFQEQHKLKHDLP